MTLLLTLLKNTTGAEERLLGYLGWGLGVRVGWGVGEQNSKDSKNLGSLLWRCPSSVSEVVVAPRQRSYCLLAAVVVNVLTRTSANERTQYTLHQHNTLHQRKLSDPSIAYSTWSWGCWWAFSSLLELPNWLECPVERRLQSMYREETTRLCRCKLRHHLCIKGKHWQHGVKRLPASAAAHLSRDQRLFLPVVFLVTLSVRISSHLSECKTSFLQTFSYTFPNCKTSFLQTFSHTFPHCKTSFLQTFSHTFPNCITHRLSATPFRTVKHHPTEFQPRLSEL